MANGIYSTGIIKMCNLIVCNICLSLGNIFDDIWFQMHTHISFILAYVCLNLDFEWFYFLCKFWCKFLQPDENVLRKRTDYRVSRISGLLQEAVNLQKTRLSFLKVWLGTERPEKKIIYASGQVIRLPPLGNSEKAITNLAAACTCCWYWCILMQNLTRH